LKNSYNFTIGELVFTIRKLSQLTQVDFSKKLGVVQSTISKVEKDIFDDVPFSLISKISTDFDTPLQNFQFGHLPTKKNNEVKAVIPAQYIERGVFKPKTIFHVLNELEKIYGVKIYKDLKLPYQFLSLSGIKYGFEFINKLYALTGENLFKAFDKLVVNNKNEKIDAIVVTKYLKSTTGMELTSPIKELKSGVMFTIKFDNHLAELNKVYSKFFEFELGMIFDTKVNFSETNSEEIEVVLG
jgi:transcriptional regulator with XRE-family HTH domain